MSRRPLKDSVLSHVPKDRVILDSGGLFAPTVPYDLEENLRLVDAQRVRFLRCSEVAYAKGDHYTTRFQTIDPVTLALGEELTYAHQLKYYDEQFPWVFARVNQRYMVRIDLIEALDRDQGLILRCPCLEPIWPTNAYCDPIAHLLPFMLAYWQRTPQVRPE